MTPYEVNGIWFDLDHVQGVTPVKDSDRYFNKHSRFVYSKEFQLILAFRDQPFPLNFFYKLQGDDSTGEMTEEKAEAEANEARTKLIAVLEKKGKQIV